jgi:hypothetical protein
MKKKEVDWEFIHHTILIITRSFVKANEAIEILKQEGIFKKGGERNGNKR